MALLIFVGCSSTPDDDRRLGEVDEAAMDSCGHAAETPTNLTAAPDEANAGSAVITVPGDDTYLITLPEGAESHATLRTTEMHTSVALFVRERGMIVHLSPDGVSSSLRHGVCPGTLVDDYRTHIHNPDDYGITFSAVGPREILVVALASQIGHNPDAPDGGDHDHDAGDHDHDAGGHDDHDGGDHDGGDHDGG